MCVCVCVCVCVILNLVSSLTYVSNNLKGHLDHQFNSELSILWYILRVRIVCEITCLPECTVDEVCYDYKEVSEPHTKLLGYFSTDWFEPDYI